MILSNETIDVLKNFAAINANIAFSPEKVLRSVAVSKNIMAKAPITEDFPYEFGIYDLSEFLGAISMFDDPSLAFDDQQKFVSISDGSSSIKYFFSSVANLVITKAEPKVTDCNLSFELTDTQLNTIRKASGTLNASHLILTPNGSKLDLTVTDKDNPTSNEFKLSIDATINTEAQFEYVLNINSFKFRQSDVYKIEVSSQHVASVKATDTEYWIALEKSSK